ncbi:MAG: DUF885 domain-containing protein [Candidatus Hydrogenedentes bacterium]|nr:DUF885 domain-containing protein [Candidatus Hydrogenedentota bacterium]
MKERVMKTFRRVLKWTTAFLILCLLVAGGLAANVVWYRPFSINLFFERVFLEVALMDPEMLSSIRILEPWGLHFHSDDLTDASPRHERELLDKAKADLATLRQYDRESLSAEQRLSADVLEWFLRNSVEGERFLYYDYPVNQLFGVQNDLPTFMATIHQVHNERDAWDYITRLRLFEEKFDQVLIGLRLRTDLGIVPPKFVIERVLAEMRGFSGQPALENILYTSFQEKLAGTTIAAELRERLLKSAELAIDEAVYPAYGRLIGCLERLEAAATTDDGVWKFKDGDAYYAYRLRTYTTTSLTPEQVHQMGLDEVARLQQEMDQRLGEAGWREGTVGERMAALARDGAQLFQEDDAGRAAALAEYQSIIDDVSAGISTVFDLRPAAPVKVERIPQFKEKTAPGAYYDAPALDGSRPGIFYANLRNMAELPKFGMRTLAYHEAIPGHHFQIALQQEMKGPTFRKFPMFTAYIEGWALYAERLAGEQGFLKDPLADLGRLQSELFRAVRLVVDTGIHYKRWTREQAIDYMESTTGMPHGDVVAEIERYIVDPGQACAYKVGQMKILELREKARQALGSGFSLNGFHNAVLSVGAVPLEILEKVVDEYIRQHPQAPLASAD